MKKGMLALTFFTIILLIYHIFSSNPSPVLDLVYLIIIAIGIIFNNENYSRFNKVIMLAPILLLILYSLFFEKINVKENSYPISMALIMVTIGFLGTLIPYNAFFGIRIFSTRSSEKNWINTHRLLFYLSIPMACLLIILQNYFPIEKIIIFTFVIWILIPLVYSIHSYLSIRKNNKTWEF